MIGKNIPGGLQAKTCSSLAGAAPGGGIASAVGVVKIIDALDAIADGNAILAASDNQTIAQPG